MVTYEMTIAVDVHTAEAARYFIQLNAPTCALPGPSAFIHEAQEMFVLDATRQNEDAKFRIVCG